MGCEISKSSKKGGNEFRSQSTVDDYKQYQLKKLAQAINQNRHRQSSLENLLDPKLLQKTGQDTIKSLNQIENNNDKNTQNKPQQLNNLSKKQMLNEQEHIYTFRKDGKFGKKSNPVELNTFLDQFPLSKSITDLDSVEN